MTGHRDRARAESFGEQAERYDRARPGYPAALVDDLVAARPRDVLDVGCGTGIAARLFAARGCRVLGVEPDPRMAAVARAYGLDVEVATFEDWDADERRFDLLVSAQAWHWVDPAAGRWKAAAVLRPGAHFAAFWNRLAHRGHVQRILDDAYRLVAPELLRDNVVLGTNRPRTREHASIAAGPFEPPAWRHYEWQRSYTVAEWLDEVATHSIHRSLDPQRLDDLLGAMAAGFAGLTDRFDVDYDTEMLLARRR